MLNVLAELLLPVAVVAGPDLTARAACCHLVAGTRHGHARGKSSGRPRGSQARLRARERITAQQAARKRAEARRRLLVPFASVTVVLAIVVALVAIS